MSKNNRDTLNDMQLDIVLTITSCKRLDLFIHTVNSFLQNCIDIYNISYFFCVDDNSDDIERDAMQKEFPFMHFHFKTNDEKGHRKSMNIIWDKLNEINPNYWIHLEDDWIFFKKEKYIERSINALNLLKERNVSQILFNKNYAEELSQNTTICGGELINDGLILHIQNEQGLTMSNCAYWPHYSFRPSLVKWETIKHLGNYNSINQFFERDYANKYATAGYRSAFFNEITCLHTGRLTREIHNPANKNAYQLNNEEQFNNNISEIIHDTKTTRKDIEPMIKVINLERRTDRRNNVQQKFKDAKIHDYEFIDAIDGNMLEPSNELSRIFNGNDFGNSCGVIGCALTHYYLWKAFIEHSKRDFILIMEDDLNLAPNFNHCISTIEKDMIERNMLFLGYHMFENERNNVSSIYDITSNTIKIDKLNNDLYIGGFFAYSINKQGAKIMIDYIEEHGIKHGIDYLMKILDNNAYECQPHIAFSQWCDGIHDVDTDIQTNTKQLALDMIDHDDDHDDEYVFYKGLDYSGSDCKFKNDQSIDWLKKEVLYRNDYVGFNTLGFIKGYIDIDNLQPSQYFGKDDGIYVKKDWWSQRIDIIRREKERLINELGFFPRLQSIITDHTKVD